MTERQGWTHSKQGIHLGVSARPLNKAAVATAMSDVPKQPATARTTVECMLKLFQRPRDRKGKIRAMAAAS